MIRNDTIVHCSGAAMVANPGEIAMSVEIQWTDADPETGAKRFVAVERFAGKWEFKVRFRRRENWTQVVPSREMWEELLDAVERRLPRREGITEADVRTVRENRDRTPAALASAD